jgi:hypothetical protein
MLEIGNGQLTLAEQRCHMALWCEPVVLARSTYSQPSLLDALVSHSCVAVRCLMKSPLIIGADARALSSASVAILTNPRLIAVNQDARGIQGMLRAAMQSNGHGRTAAAAAPLPPLPPLPPAVRQAPNGSEWVGPCTFGAAVVADQQWQIAEGGRLVNTKLLEQSQQTERHNLGKMCLAHSAAGGGSGAVTVVPCAAGPSAALSWDFGRANLTLSQIRDVGNSSCLTYDGSSLHMQACRVETSDTPEPGKNCTDSPCRFSSLSDQLWYLNSRHQLSSSFTNWQAPPGAASRVAASNIPMCLVTGGGKQPPPTPNPPDPQIDPSLPLQVWAGPLSGGKVAVLLLNTGNLSETITALWADIDLPAGATVAVTDMWSGKSTGNATEKITATVRPHDVAAFLLSTHQWVAE